VHVPVSVRSTRTFDGVICFGGEDWWYHNRGHFDMQMMRELSNRCPVLYVNSIGMRMPRVREGKMFFRRVARKLRSLRRGLVRVRPNFAVLSPFAAPGRTGMAVSRRVLPGQIRRSAARIGVRRPLVWVSCPPGVEALERLGGECLVYQRTDRYEFFKGVDHDLIRSYDLKLKAKADVTVFCSKVLFEEEGHECRHAALVEHGVDFDLFAGAGGVGGRLGEEPRDLRLISRPRVGFVGGIDAHTFDPALFLEVARLLPKFQFVLVGACSLRRGWCTLPNVTLVGQRPYEEVPAYMAACDVLIMPWNKSPWIKACNPIKMKEYLAVGRPIVSTPFDELRYYEGLIAVAANAQEFAAAIAGAVNAPGEAARRRERVRNHPWGGKASQVLDELSTCEVVLAADAHG
jgi:glycosyltransferase involved in cell wall biosynthesis